MSRGPSRGASWLLKVLGFGFVALAAVGAFLPLLPTTPFLIVAAACFARSSERWHRWLLANRTFGPLIRDWQERRCIPRGAKVFSIVVMAAVGGSSLAFAVESLPLRLVGGAAVLTGVAFVARIRTCPPGVVRSLR